MADLRPLREADELVQHADRQVAEVQELLADLRAMLETAEESLRLCRRIGEAAGRDAEHLGTVLAAGRREQEALQARLAGHQPLPEFLHAPGDAETLSAGRPSSVNEAERLAPQLPSFVRPTLQELRAEALAKPEPARELIWKALTEELPTLESALEAAESLRRAQVDRVAEHEPARARRRQAEPPTTRSQKETKRHG